MLYLLDANVLISANNQYYALNAVPEFWDWMLHVAAAGYVKMPRETLGELKGGNAEKDALHGWAARQDVRDALALREEVDADLVRRVIAEGYAPDLRDDEYDLLGQDPFLIAHALRAPQDRVVVSMEVSKPSLTRAKRKVPDVCKTMKLNCRDTFQFIRELGFRTNWKQ